MKTKNQNHLEIQKVGKFLCGYFGQKISNLVPIGRGQWSQTFSFSLKEDNYVVRFGNSIEPFKKDEMVIKYSSVNLPIPKIIKIGKALGFYFAISDHMYGEDLDEINNDKMKGVAPSIFKMLDAIRTADISNSTGYGEWDAVGLGSYRSWHEFLLDVKNDHQNSKIHGWKKSMETSPMVAQLFSKTFQYLKSHINKCPEDRFLVHADLLYYNVLVLGERISAVFDWGNSIYGDFLYDLANFSFWAPWYPSMRGIDWSAEALRHYKEIGIDTRDFSERLHCYEIHIGLRGMAWNAFKESWTELKITAERIENLMN